MNPSVEMYFHARKTKLTAYLLWFLLDGLFLHRIYLNRWLCFVLSILLFGVGLWYAAKTDDESLLSLCALPVGILWLFDLFYIPRMVKTYNLKLALRLNLSDIPEK